MRNFSIAFFIVAVVSRATPQGTAGDIRFRLAESYEQNGDFEAAVATIREHNLPFIVGPMETPVWPPCATRMGTS